MGLKWRKTRPDGKGGIRDNRIADQEESPCLMGLSGGQKIPLVLDPQIISYTRSKDGKRISYHLGREKIANALKGLSGNQQQYVLVTPKSTDGPTQSTDTTSPTTKTTGTQQKLFPTNSPTLTSWWRDFHAKHLASLESVEDFRKPEALSFLKSLGFLPTKDPDIFFLKMLKVYLVTNMEKLSRQFLKFSPTLGIYCNGKFSIVRTTESRKIGKECSLSDILEENVDQKYFLSERATKKILEMMGETQRPMQLIQAAERDVTDRGKQTQEQ